MPDPSSTQSTPSDARAEKLEVIRTLFGDDAALRLAAAAPKPTTPAVVNADPERVAWQRNRLIQHLRRNATTPSSPAPDRPTETKPSRAPQPKAEPKTPRRTPHLSHMLSVMSDVDLVGEHPAVIAHILRNQDQNRRVSVLKALPGRTARAVMSRLRNG